MHLQRPSFPHRARTQKRGDATRAEIVAAALRLIEQGDFRPNLKAIAGEAGRTEHAVWRNWGAVELLMRDLARTKAPEVAAAVRKHWPGVADAAATDDKALAWLVLVGKPRD